MKRYSDPELEVMSFAIVDVTNNNDDDFGGDNEISASQMFDNIQYDW